jgi:hypothetical protein
MHHQLVQLARNLISGTRLALFMPVRRLAFRFGIAEALLLFALSAVLDYGIDWLRYGPDAYFSWYGAGSELFSGGLLLLTAALLAVLYRQPAMVLALPVVVLSALPVIQIAHAVPEGISRYGPEGFGFPSWLEFVFIAWLVAMLVRAVAVAAEPGRGRRWMQALAGGLALASPLWLAPALTPTEPWWKQPALTGDVDPRYPSAASEPVLAAQAELLNRALDELDDERPNVADVYFVAFGGYASEDVFRKDVELAQQVMDERWGTEGRSVVLLNNPRTLLERPMATVTNLRETLREIAGALDVEQDVVMLYLASHGTQQPTLEVAMPPLELAPVTPAVLRGLFDEAGIKWRIVVVSSCYSGGFVPALQDDHTLVITAAQADRTSFGCGFRSDGTYFGQAFFGEGLTHADTLLEAFAIAKQQIASREQAAHIARPSNPQLYVGPAMKDKLKELDRGGAARRAARTA